eukprot:CAMPEP_0175843252 /NCGR_PEP_ID=MMETSP0107_2-20121207/20987_1 /TAXON_ID=195067 ORGANISM="Goniomonas pacifica, Strain CCMP1869" /NCGR_SAMPLE_ID=MMETSP0107_2 /ASSEMBLY_ACC=CAM_ASM_000203 /LENGTH=48 /DNA_ID= /DNA_START= /DNA_END= /DNA_ORIENTATION=
MTSVALTLAAKRHLTSLTSPSLAACPNTDATRCYDKTDTVCECVRMPC